MGRGGSWTEAPAGVKIDALLKDAEWSLTDGTSVIFEHTLVDGIQADYVLLRPRAAMTFRGFLTPT